MRFDRILSQPGVAPYPGLSEMYRWKDAWCLPSEVVQGNGTKDSPRWELDKESGHPV